MADYWKSQPRKFCEFCKCWIADNKPSREFHEKGKKHQENVQKKIDEVMKKGRQAAAAKAEMSETLKEMEKAALKALKNDLQRDPSLAAQYGVKIKQKETDKKPDKCDSNPSQHEPASTNKTKTCETKTSEAKTDPNLIWKEEWTPEGFVYYWNTETGESVWEKPEGYIPTWERAVKEQLQQDEDDIELEPVTSADLEEDTEVKKEAECKEELANENIKAEVTEPTDIKDIPLPHSGKSQDSEANDESSIPAPEVGPPTRTEAAKRANTSIYGEWEAVKQEEEPETVDLQLPIKKDPQPEPVKTITLSEPKIKFRQKKVDTLGAEFVAFKKRKMAASRKENMRKTDSEHV